MIRFDDARRTLELSVHDLVEAGPARGDLHVQVAWSARARMRAGQEAHAGWAAARASEDAAFRSEVTVRHLVAVRGWEARITGRIDGVSVEADRVVVEEVKSTALPAARLERASAADFPAWRRQLELYLHFVAQGETRPVSGRLVLVSLHDGRRHVLPVEPRPDMAAWIAERLEWLVLERERRLAWLTRRRAGPVPFAHAGWRPGQEDAARSLRAALDRGRHVLLHAPTGTGKTAAALHAAIGHAWATGRRVWFATARTTQQRMALDTVRAMARNGLPVRAVALRAREKVCLNEVDGEPLVLCEPEHCRHAAGHFDRVREHELAARAWAGEGVPEIEAVVDLAAAHTVCPFALSMELAAGADVVIGDYNYVFDPALRLAVLDEEPWVVIVDEAHQLPDRAMGYGSPALRLATVEAAARALGAAGPAWKAQRRLLDDLADWLRSGCDRVPPEAREGAAAFALDGADGGPALGRALRDFARRFEELALETALLTLRDRPFPDGADPWIETARAVNRMRAALDRAGPETVAVWRRGASRQARLFGGGGDAAGVDLLCRDPSGILGPAFAAMAASVSMSATLEPLDFYEAMTGLPADRVERLVRPSPFPPENRRVLVVPSVSTEYRRRERDREATAAILGEVLAAVPGNVAIFFPSFAFLEAVAPLVEVGARPVLVQERGMGEADRARLLAALAEARGHVLFAVLGGIFAEGVDLPGDALLAAVVVGPALPAATLERRLLQAWFEERHGQGRRYAWLVPGMGRVVQAAGRVVRGPEDRGAVVLVGRRFLQRDYAAFFPEDWAPERTTAPGEALAGFWDRAG